MSAELLGRLKQQAASLSLRGLGRWLCDALGLVGPSGKPQLSVAVQMVRALVKGGILSLVSRSAPCCSRSPRAALGEPDALKAACFAGSLDELGPIELIPVPSRWSRDYRRWRHLLQTHH
ncbi:MAG TPA: hypothetical protein PKW90_07205, partial [Myxococcota bacterium]|nr:hypothetical protein [Myxococcota bacterium]